MDYRIDPNCYVGGCGEVAKYRVETWPMGTRVDTYRMHIAVAADNHTTSLRPVLVLPLRFT